MKRGTKLYLVNSDGQTVGPFRWTLVREWLALSLLAENSWVAIYGEDEWQPIYDFPELLKLPASLADASSTVSYYKESDRYIKPSVPEQHEYLAKLGCPFLGETIDFYLLNHVISALEKEFPDRIDKDLRHKIEVSSDWGNAAASEKQIEYLKSTGASVSKSLTKKQASAIIDPPTEGQLRRLKFYGISVDSITKVDAINLIDDYKRAHPESEAAYQKWKNTASTSTRRPEDGRPAGKGMTQAGFIIMCIGVVLSFVPGETRTLGFMGLALGFVLVVAGRYRSD